MATSSAIGIIKSASTNARRRKKFPENAVDHLGEYDEDDGVGASSGVVRKVVLPRPRNTTTTRTWRTYVRWTARVLLVVVAILSCARVVRIPGPPSATVLLIMTHSRARYLSRCLESVLQTPNRYSWDILVSRDRADGKNHTEVDAVLARYYSQGQLAHIFTHEPKVDPGVLSEGNITSNNIDPEFVDEAAYRRISAHYKYALSAAFARYPGTERVVVLEDDMLIGRDFFDYFERLTPVLEGDDTLWCVSAWNDNGPPQLAKNSSQLFRTDFFPGLGWMLTRRLWVDELRDKWPHSFWDDWMRRPDIAKGRHCIRPEVSRAENFGQHGASAASNYASHIAKVRTLNTDNNNMDMDIDLAYLAPHKFHHMFFTRMSNATLLKYSNYLTSRPQDGDVIAKYPPGRPYAIGKRTGIMTDHRFGIFRTSYKGVIPIAWNNHWAFIVPSDYQPPEGYQLGARECC